MGVKELKNNLFGKSQKLLKEIEQKKDIFILANSTIDGIISGSIILKSIYNNMGNATIRCSCKKIEDTLFEIIDEKHEFYIFTDFDSNAIDNINKLFNEGNYLFINTDTITKSDNSTHENIINPWLFNVNGKEEVSSAGLSYFLIKNFDRNSNSLSQLPIISAISKDQDSGENRSLISLNNEILQISIKENIIEQKKGLTISEIETTPITDVLENNIIHYIKGITWNRESSLRIAKDSHLSPGKKGIKKPFDELDEKESIQLVESIERFLQENSKSNNKKIIKDVLYGYRYVLIDEENDGLLKNSRSFVKVMESLLNAQKTGLALALCLGDRGEILKEVHGIITEHNNSIRNISFQLFGEKWRFYDNKETIFINGEGILNNQNVKSFISFLENSVSFGDRLICLRLLDSEEFYKVIIAKTKFCNFNLMNIEEKVMRGTLDKGNVKIIDKTKIEIKISVSNLEDFLSTIKKIIIDEKISQP
jgi:RecJ-like exonuclease